MEPRRRLLASVVQSVMLYDAPIWATSLECSEKSRGELLKVQRQTALRSICGYRPIFCDAINILASVPPIDLIAIERRKLFLIRRELTRKTVQEAKEKTTMKWLQRVKDATKGVWTRTLIRDVRKWVTRKHGSMDFHLSQILSRHGCFSFYTHRIGSQLQALPIKPRQRVSHAGGMQGMGSRKGGDGSNNQPTGPRHSGGEDG